MKLISIGFGSLIAPGRVLTVLEPESAPIKRVMQEAKERGLLIDASYGRKTRSVILMDTDHVILSALTPEALAARWEDAKEASENMLANIISLVSGCVTFLGGFLIVWGAVSLGLAIREQQGGAQIASAISTIAGGAIIVAAAVYFGMLDTSWLPA